MGRQERIYAIDRLLKQRGALTLEEFILELEVSRATFRRDLDYLRERLHSPIIWDATAKKYRYEMTSDNVKAYALPGLWFNQSEIHALIAMQQLLENIVPSLLEPHLGPLKKKLFSLLDKGTIEHRLIGERVRISSLAQRRTSAVSFAEVARALLNRQRLLVVYHNRYCGETLQRELSPLRLIYYRDNWYLDSWCHLRDDLRRFAVDSMASVIVLQETAREVAVDILNARFEAGYGMFPGTQTHWATLRFTPYRARWVANEVWHKDQVGSFDQQGHYILKLPYNDPRELVADILRQGDECEVLAPVSLRAVAADKVKRLANIYASQ